MKNINPTNKSQYRYLFSAALVVLLLGLMSFRAAAQTPLLPGTIGQIVYHDLNRNFAQDAGEGLSNVTVELLDSNGVVTRTTMTDVDGLYRFNDLPFGDYTIRIVTSTLPNDKQGSANVSDPDGGTPDESNTTLSVGTPTDFTQNFGYFGLPTHVTLAGSTAVPTYTLPLITFFLAISTVTIILPRFGFLRI